MSCCQPKPRADLEWIFSRVKADRGTPWWQTWSVSGKEIDLAAAGSCSGSGFLFSQVIVYRAVLTRTITKATATQVNFQRALSSLLMSPTRETQLGTPAFALRYLGLHPYRSLTSDESVFRSSVGRTALRLRNATVSEA
jgi:hypothetical protein